MTDRSKAFLKLGGFIVFLFLIYGINVIIQEARKDKKGSELTKPQKEYTTKPNYKLELLAWSWSETASGGYVKAKGQVKNISGQSLRNVMAVVTFYDGNGNFITADEALIDYNPILPDQKSPFSVLETYNPAMKGATVEFKFLLGGTISTQRK